VRFVNPSSGSGTTNTTFNSLCEILYQILRWQPSSNSSFNSLCEILQLFIYTLAWYRLTFNSLCEIPPHFIFSSQTRSLFQFSLWDSLLWNICRCKNLLKLSILFVRFYRRTSPPCSRQISFNSLCEILEWGEAIQVDLKDSFNSLCEIQQGRDKKGLPVICLSILFVRFWRWERRLLQRKLHFQFSLWDSDPWAPYGFRPFPFNSLCEIRSRIGGLGRTPSSSLSILFVRFQVRPRAEGERIKELSILFVRFNKRLRGAAKSVLLLSILFVRFPRGSNRGLEPRTFNSLCEIRIAYELWSKPEKFSFNSLCEIPWPLYRLRAYRAM